MEITEVTNLAEKLSRELLEVWEDSVRATHTFLSVNGIENIKKYVPEALKMVEHLVILKDENNLSVAFMGIGERKLEMLFVENNKRGKGIGKKLINYGIEKYNVNELTVNE